MKAGVFVTCLEFPPTITEPPTVQMKHSSFGGALCTRSLIPTQDGECEGLSYITIPGSVSMTGNIFKSFEA